MAVAQSLTEVEKLIDEDPIEQLSKILKHPLIKAYLKPNIEILDLLTQDIEQQLAKEGKQFWFSESWPNSLKAEVEKIVDKLKLNKKDYEINIGNNQWLHEIWAMPLMLRNKKDHNLIRPSAYWCGDNLEDAVKLLYICAETKISSEGNSKKGKILLLLNEANNPKNIQCSSSQANLLALYSRADQRFAKLCTILGIWKHRKFDKIDHEGAFSMYAFALMLIHFLQVGCDPPVLPCLHKMGINPLTCNPFDIKFVSKNEKSLSNLLFNFFSYYQPKAFGGFDFERWKISVKEGEPIKLASRSRTFFIEDPLEEGSKNVVNYAHSPGLSYFLAFIFMQIRTRLLKKRRLQQLEDALVV